MKINWTTILLIVAIVFATLYLRSCFDKTPVDEKIIRADVKIEQLEKQRLADSIALKQIRWEKDSAIAVSTEKFNNLEKQKQPIIYAIKQNNAAVDNFDKEQLRRASREYYNSHH